MSKDDFTVSINASKTNPKVIEIDASLIAAIIDGCLNVKRKHHHKVAVAANEICDYIGQQIRDAQSFRN